MATKKKKEQKPLPGFEPKPPAPPVQLTPEQAKQFERDFWWMMMKVETALENLRYARYEFYQFAEKYIGEDPVRLRFHAYASASNAEYIEQLERENDKAHDFVVSNAKARLFDLYCDAYSKLPAYLQQLLKAVEDRGAGAELQVSKKASTYPAYLKLVERDFLTLVAETPVTATFSLKPELVPVVFED